MVLLLIRVRRPFSPMAVPNATGYLARNGSPHNRRGWPSRHRCKYIPVRWLSDIHVLQPAEPGSPTPYLGSRFEFSRDRRGAGKAHPAGSSPRRSALEGVPREPLKYSARVCVALRARLQGVSRRQYREYWQAEQRSQPCAQGRARRGFQRTRISASIPLEMFSTFLRGTSLIFALAESQTRAEYFRGSLDVFEVVVLIERDDRLLA